MGYMTVVSILNDAWETIKRHPEEFIENIEKGMNHPYYQDGAVQSYPVGNYYNPMEVAASFHADVPQVFYAGRNCMTMLTDHTAKKKNDIEFQLERAQEAKKVLNRQEKELKEKLKRFDEYEAGDILLCKKELKFSRKKENPVLLKRGSHYQVESIDDKYAFFVGENEENAVIPVLDVDLYFEREEEKNGN